MRTMLIVALLLSAVVRADVIVSNVTTVSTVMTSNTVTFSRARCVYTSFSIQYLPPDLHHFVFTISYFLQDEATGLEIPGTRRLSRLSDQEFAAFMLENEIDFATVSNQMGAIINLYLRKKVTTLQ